MKVAITEVNVLIIHYIICLRTIPLSTQHPRRRPQVYTAFSVLFLFMPVAIRVWDGALGLPLIPACLCAFKHRLCLRYLSIRTCINPPSLTICV